MNVTGYPTLFYYRNSDDPTLRTEEMFEPIKYEGKVAFEYSSRIVNYFMVDLYILF